MSGGQNVGTSPDDGGGLQAWAEHFLPHYFSEAPSAFHTELMRDLSNFRQRLIARVAPRGHAKSTCASLALPLWAVCQRRARNIVIISQEQSLAASFLRDIRTELEGNERIHDAYGSLAPAAKGKRANRKWGESLLITTSEIAIHAKGVGASIRGVRVGPHRPDLIICDDIEKDALVERASNRAKLEHWLRKAVLPALAPRGRLVLLGSILHHDSLLAKMRDRKLFPGWDYRVYRAVEPELRADGSWVLNALWPARWPLERLEQERERIGSIAFEQEYMANPVDTSLRVFTPEMLKRYEEGELAGRDLATLVAVDPATGSEGGDFFAVWVGSVDLNDGTIFTRELLLERIDFRAQVRRIREVCERWQPLKVGIESNAYQKSLLHSVEEMGRAYRLYVPLVEIRSVTRKELRIEAVAPLFESGVFRLPVQLDPEAELQFLQFPRAAHDDGPDVCAMGVELARSLRPMACAAPATGRVANSTWRGW